jgi:hypothetical protein
VVTDPFRQFAHAYNADDEHDKTYTAELGHPGGPNIHRYDSTSIEAATDDDAINRATEWSKNPGRQVDHGTWLRVTSGSELVHEQQLD